MKTNRRLASLLTLGTLSFTSTAFSGDLGRPIFCSHDVQDASLVLAEESVNEAGIGYDLRFEVRGESRGLKKNFLGLMNKAEPGKLQSVFASGDNRIASYLDTEIVFSADHISDGSNHFLKLIRRNENLLLIDGQKMFASDATEIKSPYELVIGTIDLNSGAIELIYEDLKIRYVTTAYSEAFFLPVYKFTGDHLQLQLGAPSYHTQYSDGECRE